MRNYFNYTLKGIKIFPYMLGATILSVLLMWPAVDQMIKEMFYGHFADPVLNLSYFGNVLLGQAMFAGRLLVIFLLAFFLVKYTVGGLSYSGERLEAEYDLKEYSWLVLKGVFFSAITFNIYLPWLIVKAVRYFASNTSFRFNTFEFNGNSLNLFSFAVIFMAVPFLVFGYVMSVMAVQLMMQNPMALVWVFLLAFVFILAACIFQAFVYKWFVDFSYGPKRIVVDVNIWKAGFFIFGQLMLTSVTLGLYFPMALLRIYRYYIGRMVLGDEIIEDRFGFTLNVWRDYGFVLLHLFLAAITAGIYGAWAYSRITERLFNRTYVEIVEEQKLPMPRGN